MGSRSRETRVGQAAGSGPLLIERFKREDRGERVRAAQLALTFDRDCDAAMFVLADTNNMEYRCRAALRLRDSEHAAAVTALAATALLVWWLISA